MSTMHHKVTVSLSLFSLDSADFYIYCVGIIRFKAWPISAAAYFSPYRNINTEVVFDVVMMTPVFLKMCLS